jgi:heptosyltransferase-2
MVESTRIRILILFILSLLFFLFRGKATRIKKDTKKVGIIYLTGNVGDMVFCTPVFRALKSTKPESKMYVVGRKRNAETLRYSPDVHMYFECPQSLFALFKLVRGLKLDYAYLLNPSVLELAIFYLANVPAIATFSAPVKTAETKTYRILKHLCLQVSFTAGENFATENLRLLNPLGIVSTDVRKHLFFSDTAKVDMEQFLKENHVTLGVDFIIALAPGAGTKEKQWPADRFAKLADSLYVKYGKPIFIVGGPGDTEEFKQMSEALTGTTKIVSCLHHSIDELKAFMSNTDLIVANDSAPIYIAEAFDKATVTVVGPTDESEHPPKGPKHRLVKSKKRGAPVLAAWSMKRYLDVRNDALQQIAEVTTEDVESVVDELITSLKK